MASFHESSRVYAGDSFTDWIAFFHLEKLQNVLAKEVGIENLIDVLEASRDPDCMEIISKAAPLLILRRFKDAVARTKIFQEDPVTYSGHDFDEWIAAFKLRGIHKHLTESIGVSSWEDLKETLADAELKENIFNFAKALGEKEYSNLLNAIENTTDLRGEVPEPEVASVQVAKEVAIPTASVLDEEKELLLKIEKEKKRLESTMRVADLKKELEALNADTALRTMRKKEEKSRLETKIRDTKEKKSLLAKLQSYLKDAASVDICMLLDCTGSMSPYIDAMKSDIVDLVASLGDLYPNIPLRVAFVGYRDHCDGDQRLAIFPFSMAVSDFKTFVGSQRAHGGGDGPEDVFGALKAATELEWAAATRFIFHIGDAPCHGKEFHGGVHDDYPEGDPMGLTAEELLRGVQSRNIQYTFGRICSGTDKMIERFNAILTGFVTTVGVSTPKSMLKSITASVTTSLSVSLSSSATTAEKVDMSTFAVDKRIPNWMTLEAEQINVYEMRDFSSVDSILDSDGIKILKASPRVEKVKVSPLPFDKGSCRLAYRALLLSNSETNIIKVYASRKVVSRSKYESASILTHATAIHLAVAFRGLSLPRGAPTIKFLPIMLVQYVERRDTPYATLEPMINGNWEKYNNNHGLVVPSPSPAHNTNHDIVQAFSHWTYVVSGKRLMVVDCQGVFEATANAFTLTDPAIHCTSDATMFGGTNLGKDGVRRFFETHKCNEYCRALKIASSL